MDAPQCWTCKHRYDIPNNAHIGCALGPIAIKQSAIEHENSATWFFQRIARQFGFEGIKINGIKNHWCYFPFVFDPVWLEGECRYYEKEQLIFSTIKKEGQ